MTVGDPTRDLKLCADGGRLSMEDILRGGEGKCPGCGVRIHNRGWGSHERAARKRLRALANASSPAPTTETNR